MAEPDETARPIQGGILDPLIGAGFFTPNMSLEEIKRRRAIAGALASRRRDYPKTIGEGMTYFSEAIADAMQERRLGEAERKYSAERDAADPTSRFLPGAAAPRPVAEAPPEILPPVATAAATPLPPAPAMARPSPLPPAPAGPLAGANPLTVEPTTGPASRDVIAQTLERLRIARLNAATGSAGGAPAPVNPMVTANASLTPSPNVGAAPAGPAPDGATIAEEGNPPIVSNAIRPMVVADASGLPRGLRPPNPQALRTVLPPYPAPSPPTPEELAAAEYVRQKPGDDVVAARAAALAAVGRQRRESADKKAQEEWKLNYGSGLKREEEEQKYERDYPVKSFEFDEARKKAALEDRLGGRKVEDFYKEFKVEHTDAIKMAGALNTVKEAEDAIKAGAITGYGSNARLNYNKMEAWLLNNGKPGGPGNVAAQTEILKSQLDSMIGMAVANIQPGDPRVSDADLKMASGQTGNIEQQKEAILKILSVARERAHNKINAFEERRHVRIGGTPLEADFQLTTRPTADPRYIDALIKNNTEADRQEFDRRFGAGAAALELGRARRRGR